MKKVYLYTHDPMLLMFYTRIEATEMFGEEDRDDPLTEIPDELHDRFLRTRQEFLLAVRDLREYTGRK